MPDTKYLTFVAMTVGPDADSHDMSALWDAAATISAQYGGYMQIMGQSAISVIFGLDENNHDNQNVSACLTAQQLSDMYKDRIKCGIAVHGAYLDISQSSRESLFQSNEAQSAIALSTDAIGQIVLNSPVVTSMKTYAVVRSVGTRYILCKMFDRNSPLFYMRSALSHITPLIGRDSELKDIVARASHAFKNNAAHLHIEGESGTGKTRLVYSAIEQIVDEQPLLKIIVSPSSHLHFEGNNVIQDFLCDVCALGAFRFKNRGEAREAFIELGLTNDLFACAYLDTHKIKGASTVWTQMTQAERQFFQAELASRLLAQLSQSTPVIVLFDDVHRNLGQAQALIQALLNNASGAHVFALSASKKLGLFAESDFTHLMKLDKLSESEILNIIRLSLSDRTAIDQYGATIAERAQGNPYVAIQLTRHLNSYASEDATLSEEKVPETLDTLFADRLQSMPEDLTKVLYNCVVLGQKFHGRLVAAMLDQQVPETEAALRRLEDMGLIRPFGAFTDIFEFTHDLVQECMYRSLSAHQRKMLHKKALQVLKAQKPSSINERLFRMAHHAFYAELYDLAYAYSFAAGMIDFERCVPSQVEENMSMALISLRRIPNTVNFERKLSYTLLHLARAMSLSGKPKEALETLGQIPLIDLGQTFEQQKIMLKTSIKWTTADYTLQQIEEIEASINLDTRIGIGNALRCAGMLSDMGHFADSNDRLRKLYPLVDKDRKSHFGLLFPAASFCQSLMSRNYAELDRAEMAHECAVVALEGVEYLFSPKKVYALTFAAVHYQTIGQHDKALPLLKEAYFLAKEFQIGMIYAVTTCSYAYSLYFATRDPVAFSIIRSGIDYTKQRGFLARMGEYYFKYAEMLHAAGRTTEARRYALRGLRYARRNREMHIIKKIEAFLAREGILLKHIPIEDMTRTALQA